MVTPSKLTLIISSLATQHVMLAAGAAPSYVSDPDFQYQEWYLGESGANVVKAWDAGYTGKGVHIRFNDDGLDYNHPDFSSEGKTLPGWKDFMPGTCSGDEPDTHGTTCAGIAAASSNDECGVGVAFDASVSGANIFRDSQYSDFNVLMQDGSCGPHKVDISSNSWGVDACKYAGARSIANCPFLSDSINVYSPCGSKGEDAGCSADKWSPGDLSSSCGDWVVEYCGYSDYHAEVGYMDPACADYYDLFIDCEYNSLSNSEIQSFVAATTYGRGGRGIVFTFASGNEFTNGDDVNFEGYLNSIYTITVAAIAGDNEHSLYSSMGAPVLISAQGGDSDQAINMYETLPMEAGKCRQGNPTSIGTSFATPVVTGVVALMLEANKELGWRDVQDVLIRSAAVIDSENEYWVTNAAGLKHSYLYGFGKVDAFAATSMAASYGTTNIAHATVTGASTAEVNIPDAEANEAVSSAITISDASAISSSQHVVVYVDIDHDYRGDLEITLTSPSGVESLLVPSTNDDGMFSASSSWKFMTLRHWGELPADLQGDWTLTLEDFGVGDTGTLKGWRLNIMGNDASGTVASSLTSECAAQDGGYDDVLLEGVCYAEEKQDSELGRGEVPQTDDEDDKDDESEYIPAEPDSSSIKLSGVSASVVAVMTAFAFLN